MFAAFNKSLKRRRYGLSVAALLGFGLACLSNVSPQARPLSDQKIVRQTTANPTATAPLYSTAIATINDPTYLPRALSATPLIADVTQATAVSTEMLAASTPTEEASAIATINSPALLPRALSATPLPESPTAPPKTVPPTANAANQSLLDQAFTNTFSSNFVRFALSTDATLTIDPVTVELHVTSTGFMANLGAIQNFTMQNTINVTTIDENGQQHDYTIEERVVQGTLYLRGENPAQNLQTRWIAIPLIDALQNALLVPLSQGLLSGSTATNATPLVNLTSADLQSVLDVMDLFGQFIVTKRTDQGQPIAQFQTVIKIDQMLHSQQALTSLLTAFQKVGHIAIGTDQIDSIVKLIQTFGTILVPHIGLTVGTQVDAQQKVLTLVTLDFAGIFNLGDVTTMNLQQVQIQANVTLSLSGYGATNPSVVQVPANPLVVTDLNAVPRDQILLPLATTTPGPTPTITISPTETAISVTAIP